MISIRKELLHLESLLAMLTSQSTLKQDSQYLVRLVRKNLLSLAEEILCLDHDRTMFDRGGNSGQGGECTCIVNMHAPSQNELEKHFPEFFSPSVFSDFEQCPHVQEKKFYASSPVNSNDFVSEVDRVQLQ